MYNKSFTTSKYSAFKALKVFMFKNQEFFPIQSYSTSYFTFKIKLMVVNCGVYKDPVFLSFELNQNKFSDRVIFQGA